MNNFFDDISKITGSAFGSAMSMKQEFDKVIQEKFEQFTNNMGFVTKEEFNILNIMCRKISEENESLKKRVAILEEATKNNKQ
jgi:BMFP domain-containing protein YqiC